MTKHLTELQDLYQEVLDALDGYGASPETMKYFASRFQDMIKCYRATVEKGA